MPIGHLPVARWAQRSLPSSCVTTGPTRCIKMPAKPDLEISPECECSRERARRHRLVAGAASPDDPT